MGNNEYIIRLFYDPPDGSSVGMAPTDTSAASQGSNDAKSKVTPGISAASVLSPMINTGLTLKAQQISTVTGSGQLAQKQSLANSAIRSVMNAGMSALGGAGIAASLGLAAGPVGAAVGVTMSAVSKMLDIATSMADINNKRLVESSAINATKARGSISWNRSRER